MELILDAGFDCPPVVRKRRPSRTLGIVLAIAIGAGILYAAECFCVQICAVSIPEQMSIAAEEAFLDASFMMDKSPLKSSPNAGGSYDALSESSQHIYDKLYKATWMQNESVRINGASDDEVFDIYCQMHFDHPELIHVGISPFAHSVTKSTRVSNTVVTLSPEYVMNKDRTTECRAELDSEIGNLVRGLRQVDDDAFKATYLHDKLCAMVEYGTPAIDSSCEGHSAFDALCGGSAVCEGYALGYALVCRGAGLKCEAIAGRLERTQDPSLAHAWNRVMVGGEWRYVDTTFDDGDPISDNYLLKTYPFMEAKGYIPFESNKLPGIIEDVAFSA